MEREALKLLEEATRSCNNIDEQRALDALMREAQPAQNTFDTHAAPSKALNTHSRLPQPAQEPVADRLERLLWEYIDLQAAHPEHKPNPKTWPHLMTYAPLPVQEPLTEKQIEVAIRDWCKTVFSEREDEPSEIDIARAIEAAHGIGEIK
jgi:hypothetical protein